MALITCEDAAFAYENGIVAEGINFSVSQGDYLCVVGENGSGKSTLIKGIAGLKQPVRGKLTRSSELMQKDIGYISQRAAINRDFPASVMEVVLSGCLGKDSFFAFYSKDDKKLAELNLERMGIGDLKSKCYRELSGGQQQRVLIARALCAAKKLLILDEPAAGLDPLAMEELYSLLHDVNVSSNVAIVMVSHDIESALKHASNILHLKTVQLFFGTALEYKNYLKSLKGGPFV